MYHVIAWRFQIYKAFKNDFNNLIIPKKMLGGCIPLTYIFLYL